MRKLLILFATAALLCVGCGKEYDDSALNNRVDNLENRVAKLEELCKQMNTNISSLQTIVNALQNNDYVTSVTPVTNNGETISYTIAFSKSAPITIYHGEKGEKGDKGETGATGAAGKDGHTPVIGVRQDTDGIYYWTLDGDWLLDNSGNKVKAEGRDGEAGKDGNTGADGQPGQPGETGQPGEPGTPGKDGKDGITPQLKIEDGYWYVSTDNGTTWTNLGKATGENGNDGAAGEDGDSFFQSVDTSDSDYVVFTLADGAEIKLPTWYAFEQLKTLCNQMNTNINALQTIIEALQQNDYITSCTPLMEDGAQVGYTITFAKSGSIVIYHGKNGQNGADGRDGEDAHSPVLGAKKDADGTLYWTLDGEWLLDDAGDKIPVHGRDGIDGKDAIAPQLKIEEGDWYVSTDNGATWTNLGRATGADGQDGENGADGQDGENGADGQDGVSFFQSVTQDEDYVYLTLSTGEQIAVPKHHPLSIAFDETEDIRVLANKTYSIGYTVTGADDHTVVKALAQDGFRAAVKQSDNATGTIEITTPATVLPSEVLVFVTDGKERTIMRSINFVEGVILISTKSYTVGYDGGTVEIDLSTNIDYTVEIPEKDQTWISVANIKTRAAVREETVVLEIAANNTQETRSSVIKIVDVFDITIETIFITQEHHYHVETAGSLHTVIPSKKKNTIEDLKLTGTLNADDYAFINTMQNLSRLDLSELNDRSMPNSCFANSTISTVLLPQRLTSIPFRAFYHAAITSIDIPETVETIGQSAFSACEQLTGDLILPDKVTTIYANAFLNCYALQSLTIGSSVTDIYPGAFARAVPDRDYYETPYYYPLNWNGIYCKNQQCPKLIYGGDPEAYDRNGYAFGYNQSTGLWPGHWLYVPVGSKAAYEQASGWKYFSLIKEIEFD